MKLRRSTTVPVILALYLAVMSWIGLPDYLAGRTSALFYFGVIGVTALVIVLLHFNLKKREQLRDERLRDLRESNK